MSALKGERDEEQQAFLLPRPQAEDASPLPQKPSRSALRYLHLAWEVVMIVALAVLLTERLSGPPEWRPLRTSPVPQLPRKLYTFAENPRYLHEDMFNNETETLHTLHNWIELSAAARGYVQIADPGPYSLPEAYNVRINHTDNGPAYMVSVFHQLHCLSYIVQHYQQGYAGTELTQEVAHHSAHCFDYLRQALMCAADTSLEGNTRQGGAGWGAEHECVDYEALLDWANKNGALPWRTLMPEESVL